MKSDSIDDDDNDNIDGNLPRYTLFIGNPGVGKSALLNAIAGEIVSRSGVSIGGGMTSHLKYHQTEDGEFYGDTPGLDDVESRERAAQEISKALRKSPGRYKLIFVVTLEAGRIKPSDLVTMRVVLDALLPVAEDGDLPYGILINKVTPAFSARLEKNRNELDELIASLSAGQTHRTPNVIMYPFLMDLADLDDVLHQPMPILWTFLETLDYMVVQQPQQVQDVQVENMAAVQDKIQNLLKHKDLLEKQLQMQEADHLRKKEQLEKKLEEKKFWASFAKGAGGVAAVLGFLILVPK